MPIWSLNNPFGDFKPAAWRVHVRGDAGDYEEYYATPESAIDSACRHISLGHDVLRMGSGLLCISAAEVVRFYEVWTRVNGALGLEGASH